MKTLQISKLKVLNDYVLVEAIREGSRGGVVIGVTTDDKPNTGKVLRVGPGRRSDISGEIIPMTLEPGQVVLFNEHTTTKFSIGIETYFVLREEDVIGFQ